MKRLFSILSLSVAALGFGLGFVPIIYCATYYIIDISKYYLIEDATYFSTEYISIFGPNESIRVFDGLRILYVASFATTAILSILAIVFPKKNTLKIVAGVSIASLFASFVGASQNLLTIQGYLGKRSVKEAILSDYSPYFGYYLLIIIFASALILALINAIVSVASRKKDIKMAPVIQRRPGEKQYNPDGTMSEEEWSGARMSQKKAPNFCKLCGCRLDEDSRFCQNCGAKL